MLMNDHERKPNIKIIIGITTSLLNHYIIDNDLNTIESNPHDKRESIKCYYGIIMILDIALPSVRRRQWSKCNIIVSRYILNIILQKNWQRYLERHFTLHPKRCLVQTFFEWMNVMQSSHLRLKAPLWHHSLIK